MTAPVEVAVGVVFDRAGRFLLAQRPDGKPMAGWWEFPGGKVEPDESVFAALVREFDEELGFHLTAAHPWAQRVFTYPHATVRLHFWRCFGDEWSGTPRSREGQDFRWESIDDATTEHWLAGALPVLRWMRLPSRYAISQASTIGVDAFIARLEHGLAEGRIAQLQLREPDLDARTFDRLFDATLARCRAQGARLLVNSVHAERYWTRADGVHLRASDLMRRQARPDADWCLASCHDAHELAKAGEIGADAAVLGPVKATATHPGVEGIGWAGFAARIAGTTLPVYAIGGLAGDDLGTAIGAGAHGIAMIRAAWA